jgi:Tfp pilus assembly protein PilO
VIASALSEWRYCLRHPWARLGTVVSAVLALTVAGLCLNWWPQNTTRVQLEEAIAAQRFEIARQHNDLDLLAAYVRARADVEALESKLDYAATQAQQVSDVAQLARKQGIIVLSQSYEMRIPKESNDTSKDAPDDAQKDPSKEAPALNTELVVQGSYRSLRNFIALVPSLPSLTQVQEVVLERAREANVVKGRIRLVTYRRDTTKVARS